MKISKHQKGKESKVVPRAAERLATETATATLNPDIEKMLDEMDRRRASTGFRREFFFPKRINQNDENHHDDY